MTGGRRLVFEGQALHLAGAVALVAAATVALSANPDARAGAWLGLSTTAWFVLALAVAVLHQAWVWIWWRTEYHLHAPSRRLGLDRAFRIYAVGFTVLLLGRPLAVIGLAVANRGTLDLPPAVGIPVAGAMVVVLAWLGRSIVLHFGIAHAMGADHFNEEHRARGLCREGIFRYVPNAMYTVGFFAVWVPALLAASAAALIAAAATHALIWVHYFATERPDLRRIYDGPDQRDPG